MKISVITPSYQQAPFILRTLQSVQMQQLDADLEHLVFDGGSQDQTVTILKQAALTMPHLTWTSEKDRGQAHAVNKGLCASQGDIIGWLNSDDVYYPYALQQVMHVFESHPDVDVIYGMADHIDKEDTPFEDYPTEPWNIERLAQTCYICQPALFFRRRVIAQCGLLDESLQYCMDYEYWLRLSTAGIKFFYLQSKLAGSRLYQETKTLGARVQAHREICDMFKTKMHKVPERWLLNYAHTVVEKKINRQTHPRYFLFLLLIHASRASIHWNKEIARSMIRFFLLAITKR